VGSELANWFLNIWAHQTLLDGCDCLFAMEMPERARGEYHGDNGRSITTKFYDEVLRQWIVANINGICVSEHYVSSRRLQTWEQKFESDTTKSTWEDRLVSLTKI
jgi:hypothetical protein